MLRATARVLLGALLEVSLLLLVAGVLLALLAFLAGRRILWDESDPLARAAGRFVRGLELLERSGLASRAARAASQAREPAN